MGVLEVWLFAGIPSLALAMALLVRRSQVRALLGYLVLAAGFGVVTVVDRASGAVLGGLIALLYAAGRGGRLEGEAGTPGVEAVPEVTRRVARDRARMRTAR